MIHEAEILSLRDESAVSGDTGTIQICNAALADDEAAWAQCERMIIPLRGNAEYFRTSHPGAWSRNA